MKFGIYTSFYNCERFVDNIFSSIEMLNYDNFEWHITDDYSTDDTKSLVLERLEKSPLKHKISYCDQSEKKHMYWKPNEFFDETFEWIILMDADDDFDKNFLNIYKDFLLGRDDVSFVSSDCFKIYEDTKSLHSMSYLINDDIISNKIKRYHPSCDYLNNTSYSCFGLLRGFKNIISSFDVDDMLACAEDSYHVFWSNSFGKYLHIPRPLYIWNLRNDSESHSKSIPPNFNGNFNLALNKLNENDGGIDKMFNDIYVETSTLASYEFGKLKGNKVSLWTRFLSQGQKDTLKKLYYDVDLIFNSSDAEIHLFSLNYFNENDLDEVLEDTRGKKMMFYYQNQNYHKTNEQKENELQLQLNKYTNIVGKHTGYSWWTYIRHFIIKN
jgi:glycosyltransferase involved in cell wall biosynthesis/ribosomal protein L33